MHTGKGQPKDRGHVISCRVSDQCVEVIDALVVAGVHSSRREAAARLLHAGIAAQRPLLERIATLAVEVHRARERARDVVHGRPRTSRRSRTLVAGNGAVAHSAGS